MNRRSAPARDAKLVITRRARRLVKKHKLIEVMAKLAAGELTYDVTIYDPDGKLVGVQRHPAKHADRINAAKILIEYAQPRPTTEVVIDNRQYVAEVPAQLTPEEWRAKWTLVKGAA